MDNKITGTETMRTSNGSLDEIFNKHDNKVPVAVITAWLKEHAGATWMGGALVSALKYGTVAFDGEHFRCTTVAEHFVHELRQRLVNVRDTKVFDAITALLDAVDVPYTDSPDPVLLGRFEGAPEIATFIAEESARRAERDRRSAEKVIVGGALAEET